MYKSHTSSFINDTWDDFDCAVQNKKLIIYGLNALLIFLQMRSNVKLNIVAAIDNDPNKQNHKLFEFMDENFLSDSKNILVSSRDILSDFNPDEVVIIISSYRYFDEIADELISYNFRFFFSILNLEYNYRKFMKENKLSYQNRNEYISQYVDECILKSPIQKNKIIFLLDDYIDHGKYITEKLLAENKNLDIVWSVKNFNVEAPFGVRIVSGGNILKYIYEMETAKIWISSVITPIYLKKRTNQIYIQIKHWGSLTLKSFSLSNSENVNQETFINNGKIMDYIISGSEFDEETCRKGFNFQGKFLRFGSPRSDILFSKEECRKKIFELFKLTGGEKILLYAPTFRLDKEKNFYDLRWQNLDFNMLKKTLTEKFGGEWKIFLRLHPQVKTRSEQIKKPNFVIDVSNYDNSQELVAASDIMISDYSSIIFEFAYVFRPVFLYAPDKDIYQLEERKLLIDYDSLPFAISTTNEQLSEQIKSYDEDYYKQRLKKFLESYGVNEDGHASERCAKFIFKIINEEENDKNE